MKVLMITREFPPYVVGGVSTHTWHLSRALERERNDVKVVSFGDPKASSGSVRFIEPKSSIISRSRQSTGRELAVICDMARYNRLLSKIVAAENFDIVHVQEPYVGGYLKAKNKVTTVHDTSYGELRSIATSSTVLRQTNKILFYLGFGVAAEYASLASSKVIITPAPIIRSELVKHYRLCSSKVITIMNGVEAENSYSSISKEEAKRRIQMSSSKLLLFTSAQHISRKRLDVLLLAISQLAAHGGVDELEVRIGGDGPMRPYLQRLAHKLGVASKVKFLGWLSEDNLSLHYRACDIFAICSDYEAGPITLLEAMIAGAPVVSTRISGFAAIATNGLNILLTPPGNPVALANILQSLMKDEQTRKTLSVNGRNFALQHTWDKVARRTLEVYNACLAS